MDYILEGIRQGFSFLFPPRKEILEIAFLSVFGISIGIFIAINDFRFRRFIIGFLNTWLALPAVIIGLLVYIFLSRRGPFGFLFTPYAMIIAQSMLALPIVSALTVSALKNSSKDVKDIA